MQDYKRNTFLEADLQCSNRIQSMESKIRTACNRPDAKLDDIVRVRLFTCRELSFHFHVLACIE